MSSDLSPKKQLWNKLKDEKLYTKSFKDFIEQFNSEKSIKALYNALISKKIYTQSYDKFKLKYFNSEFYFNANFSDYEDFWKQFKNLSKSDSLEFLFKSGLSKSTIKTLDSLHIGNTNKIRKFVNYFIFLICNLLLKILKGIRFFILFPITF